MLNILSPAHLIEPTQWPDMSAGKSIPVCFAQNTTINLQSVTAALAGDATFDTDAYRPDLTKSWTLAITNLVDPFLFAIYNVGYTSKTGIPRNLQLSINNSDPMAARSVQAESTEFNPMLLNFKAYRAVGASVTATLDASGLTNEGMVRAAKMTTNWTSQGRLRTGTPSATEQGGVSGLWELRNFNGRLFNGGGAGGLVAANAAFDSNVSSQPQFTQRQANQGSYQVLYPVNITNHLVPIVATLSNSCSYTGSFDQATSSASISAVNQPASYPFPIGSSAQRAYGTWGISDNQWEAGLQSFTNLDPAAALNFKHTLAFELYVAPGGLFRSLQKQRVVVVDDMLIKSAFKFMQAQPSDYPASYNDFNTTLKSFNNFIRPIASIGGPIMSLLEPEFAPVSSAINAWVQADNINDPKRGGSVPPRMTTTNNYPGGLGSAVVAPSKSRIPSLQRQPRFTTAPAPTMPRPQKVSEAFVRANADNHHLVSCRGCGMQVKASKMPSHQAAKCRGRRVVVPR